MSRVIICVTSFFWLACVRQTAPAAESALTDTERQKLTSVVKDLDSSNPQTLDSALQRLLAMGPKAAGALDRLTLMLADGRRLTYPDSSRSGSKTFQVNVIVVWVLRSIGPQAVPALVAALKNEDENVRLPAIQALAELRQHVPLKAWLDAVRDSNMYVQICAARELAKSKDPAVVAALCNVLQDEDLELRIEVAKALGQVGDEKAIIPLIEALPNDRVNVNVETAVGKALAKMGTPAVIVLLEKIETLDESGRRMVNTAIRSVDALQTRQVLLECLKSKHWQVREAAVNALATLKTPESLRVITDSVDDPDWHVRWTAARMLGDLANDKLADAIRPILLKMAANDVDARVRENALWTLYYFPTIPTDDYWTTLEVALHDQSPKVRAAAANSCGKFPNAKFGPRLIELLNDVDGDVRAESALALSSGNIRHAVPELIRLLDDKDLHCVSSAAAALGTLGTDEAVAALITKLRDTPSDDERRGLALHGLCFTANSMAIKPLVDALEDRSLIGYHLEIKNALQKLGKE